MLVCKRFSGLLMNGAIVSYGFQYACYLIEAGLIVFMTRSRRRNRLVSPLLYLSCSLGASLERMFALHRYGVKSPSYFSAYWTTDFPLMVSLFVLVCVFFRRACADEEKMWRYVRYFLVFVFVAVVGISGLFFSRNYNSLVADFVLEFSQNLYFTCLVLTTLLYLLLQYIDSLDEQLGLLVCGVGIQLAGPTATLALIRLTGAEHFAETLNSLAMRLCTLGMLLIWAYAIVHVKDEARISGRQRRLPVWA
jgi:hypothetical protein